MNTLKKHFAQGLRIRISLIIFVFIFAAPSVFYAQSTPPIQWQKCLGGSRTDDAQSIIQTFDGGYAIAGSTESFNGDVSGLHMNTYQSPDVWVVKLSSLGIIKWQKCLGGKGLDQAYTIIQTSDGGYAVAGYTSSNDGDVSGLHIDSNTYHHYDAWIVRLDSSGSIKWQKCLGGTAHDGAFSIVQTSGGGFVMVGWTASHDGDISGEHISLMDGWVVNLDSLGNIVWQKCLGGTGFEWINSIINTPDGGYAVVGTTTSFDGDVSGFHGGLDTSGNYVPDIWVVKLNAIHKIEWQKCFGGTGEEGANSIIQTSDKGYAIAGYTRSSDGDVSGSHGPDTTISDQDTIITGKNNSDAWVIKLDSLGNMEWQKCVGGTLEDEAHSIIQSSDGGYIFTGSTNSTDGDVAGLHGKNYDAWIVKLSSSGKILWQKCLGGTDDDRGYSLIRTLGGGYAIAGTTLSIDGDVSGWHHQDTIVIKHGDTIYKTIEARANDAWIVKLGSVSGVQKNYSAVNSLLNLSCYPNPAARVVTLGYDLSKASVVNITICNITGEQIKEIYKPTEQIGHHDMLIDLASFSECSYFIKVTASGLSETSELEVIR